MTKRWLFFMSALICVLLTLAQEKVDQNMVNKIREEALNKSRVMDIALHLTDLNGNRLANSPGYKRAAGYSVDFLKSIGLDNAHQEAWGEFGKGWELEKAYFAMTAPYYKPILAYPKTWTVGTKGLKNAEVMVIEMKDSLALMNYKGKLKGKILLPDMNYNYVHSFKADAERYSDEDLKKMADAAPGRQQRDTAQMRRIREQMQRAMAPQRMLNILKNMAKEEGAVAILSSSLRNHDGTIFAQGGGSYKATDPDNFLDLVIGVEDYNTMLRISKNGMSVKADADVKTKFYNDDLNGYNVIAEIPGTDPSLKDEVVMIGAHLDSWQTGTGATDNASGSSVMLEVMRILKSLNIQPRRTIRIGLWSAEEQGLLGSRAYVAKTFGGNAANPKTAAHEKFSSYFNIDNGTGKVRGIYLQGNEACNDIFTAWLEPFKDLGATTVTINNTGGTDHQSFDGVGLPGFQFIQDEIEYDTRTHHSNMDVYDHLIENDLKQIAAVVCSFAYHAAQRDQKIPRKK
ncbi:MAG: M20/M25/M40 family metallo-hydrolase [Bacteroidota bacterium]|jgi:carboxypeptidase Q